MRRAFGFVRDDVLKNTGNRQEPFVYGSLGGDDVPLVPAQGRSRRRRRPIPQAETRRDYELALQIGNKDALNAFLAQYPDGFYANLAKIQLDKIAAEEARVAATEKARLAEQERARLAAEGAQKAQQAKAEADAKAAEQARIAAEKAKQVAQEQAAAAERKRAATEKAAADNGRQSCRQARPQPPRTRPEPGLAERRAAAGRRRQNRCRPSCAASAVSPADADGDWNAASQRSLTLFNRYAGTKFDVKLASIDALDAIKLKSSRVCPLVCEHGFKADGDAAARSSAPKARSSTTTMSARSAATRSRSPSATTGARSRPDAKQRSAGRQHVQAADGVGGGRVGSGAAAGVAKRAAGARRSWRRYDLRRHE